MQWIQKEWNGIMINEEGKVFKEVLDLLKK